MSIRVFLKGNKRKLIILIAPLLLLPLPLVGQSQESKCGYGLLVMAIYWVTEALPISATALMPIVIFPMLGVAPVSALVTKYASSVLMVFMGGMGMAISIQKWNLHRRFALRLLLFFGTTTKWLTFGFMITTAFLSMWVSNTATTSMMIPIGQAVLVELVKVRKRDSDTETEKTEKNDHVEIQINGEKLKLEEESSKRLIEKHPQDDVFVFEDLDKETQDLCKLICLCICYSANCGGIGTMTGTAPNLVLKGQLDLLAGGRSGISFATWFIFGFPITVVTTIMNWAILMVIFCGWRSLFCKYNDTENPGKIKSILNQQYQNLGPMTFAEKAVCVFFVLLVLLWFTLEPEFVPGWGHFFKHGYLSDAVAGFIILLVLFIFPSRRRSKSEDRSKEIPPLLDWQTFQQKMPWGVMLLLGGGFALAYACQVSKLSLWLGGQLSVLKGIPIWIMIFIVCTFVSLATEITSNTATTTIILPILAEMAVGMRVHPTFLMLPAAVSSSFAFMLPVATPPNTLAFSYGYLKVKDMIKSGVFLNISCVFIVTIAINTYGAAFFNLYEYPDWELLHAMSNHTDISLNSTTV